MWTVVGSAPGGPLTCSGTRAPGGVVLPAPTPGKERPIGPSQATPYLGWMRFRERLRRLIFDIGIPPGLPHDPQGPPMPRPEELAAWLRGRRRRDRGGPRVGDHGRPLALRLLWPPTGWRHGRGVWGDAHGHGSIPEGQGPLLQAMQSMRGHGLRLVRPIAPPPPGLLPVSPGPAGTPLRARGAAAVENSPHWPRASGRGRRV